MLKQLILPIDRWAFENQHNFIILSLHRKDTMKKTNGAILCTELPRFHGIKRYFKNSLNCP